MVGRNLQERAPEGVAIIATSRQDLDLMDAAAVMAYVAAQKPDVIIHAAGRVGGIRANMADPYGFFMDNATMGLNVVRAAVKAEVLRLINLSSTCVYPTTANNPFSEDAFLTGPFEPTNEGYALAKASVMRACQYASSQFDHLSYKTIVPSNLYGRHDNFHPIRSHLIPAIIRKVSDAIDTGDSEVEIWGTGQVRREFMYTGDLADFVWFALDRLETMPEVVNCSPGQDWSILEYYQKVAEVLGYTGGFTHNLDQPDGIAQKLASNMQMTQMGFEVTTSLTRGLEQTIAFYKEEICPKK